MRRRLVGEIFELWVGDERYVGRIKGQKWTGWSVLWRWEWWMVESSFQHSCCGIASSSLGLLWLCFLTD